MKSEDLMEGVKESAAEPQSIIEQLFESAKRVQTDDLSELAKMHGLCESLVDLCKPDGVCPNEEIAKAAPTVAILLESIILDEAEDAEAALAKVREATITLESFDALGEGADQGAGSSRQANDTAPQHIVDIPALPETVDAETRASASLPESAGAQPTDPADEPDAYDQQPLLINERELEFVKAFLEEAREHIEAIEVNVLDVERAPENLDKINDLFRPFHTIKGAAGFLNLTDVQCLTHEIETIMDQARTGDRPVSAGLIDIIFKVVDVLKLQLAAIEDYCEKPDGRTVPQPPVIDLISYLRKIVAGSVSQDTPIPTAEGDEDGSGKIGDALVQQGAVSTEGMQAALDMQQANPNRKAGEILMHADTVNAKQVRQALKQQGEGAGSQQRSSENAAEPTKSSRGEQSVRIETNKLDALVDMVGELVIAQAQVHAHLAGTSDPTLNKSLGQVSKIVRDVQEVAMSMRMVPIGPTFQKMARVIRDVSRKAGKKVELTISGEDTELDKNVIQQISDPLIHMVRNAVDHGVEDPETRAASCKSETGHVQLVAGHQGGNIVIEIHDDGKGLDPDKLLAKARDKGLIGDEEELSEKEIFQLIFAPGFSMAAQVTDISGRGVGMDVVKRNIEALRGRVEISSQKGEGTVFSIHLPLTLAIIDGMIIRVASERFIVPTLAVEQSLRPTEAQVSTVQHRGEMINVRDQLIPLVQLAELFGMGRHQAPQEAMVVIAQSEGTRVGLVVDELLDQQQVVIKSLGEKFRDLRGIAGAAILGDGRVGLILDMAGVAVAHRNSMTNSRLIPSCGGGKNGAARPQETTSGQEADSEPETAIEPETNSESAIDTEPTILAEPEPATAGAAVVDSEPAVTVKERPAVAAPGTTPAAPAEETSAPAAGPAFEALQADPDFDFDEGIESF